MWFRYFMMWLIIFQTWPAVGWGQEKEVLSVIVWPVSDENTDEDSNMMSSILLGELSNNPQFYLIDPEKVTSVLRYYPAPAKEVKEFSVEESVARGKEHYFNFNYTDAAVELHYPRQERG